MPSLICDAMLGELSRWLRLMGYDTLFMPNVPDLDIVRRARYEGRIVLTQDGPLARHPAVTAVYIQSDTLDEQIAQVKEAVGDPHEGASARCAVCNSPLHLLPRAEAKRRVPPYVWRTHEQFSECPGCRRVYWRGTHWEAIESRLNED